MVTEKTEGRKADAPRWKTEAQVAYVIIELRISIKNEKFARSCWFV